jgi:hypothetical protein
MIKEIRSLEQSFSGRHEQVLIQHSLFSTQLKSIRDGVTLRLSRASDSVLREEVKPAMAI